MIPTNDMQIAVMIEESNKDMILNLSTLFILVLLTSSPNNNKLYLLDENKKKIIDINITIKTINISLYDIRLKSPNDQYIALDKVTSFAKYCKRVVKAVKSEEKATPVRIILEEEKCLIFAKNKIIRIVKNAKKKANKETK